LFQPAAEVVDMDVQDVVDGILQQQMQHPRGSFPDAVSTPGAGSSVRLSDINLNGDDFEQL